MIKRSALVRVGMVDGDCELKPQRKYHARRAIDSRN